MKKAEQSVRPSVLLGIPCFAVGAVFLFNPFLNIFDFLPDFIGALFMLAALRRLRDVTPYLESARRGFLRFFWFSLSRIPAFFLMFRIFHEHTAEQSIMLVFTFTYAILETVLLVVVFLNLFDGFIYIGERYEGTAAFHIVRTVKTENGFVFAPEKQRKTQHSNKKPRRPFGVSSLKWLTVISMSLLRLLSVLPELVYLSGQSGDPSLSLYRVPQTEFKAFYTVLSFLPALAIGIVWLVAFRRYIHGLCADDCFCSGLLSYLDTNYPPEHKLHSYRKFCRATVFLTAAVFLALDFFIDEQSLFPDVLSAALLLFSVLYVGKKLFPMPVWMTVLAFFPFAGGAVSFWLSLSFHRRFSFSDVWRRDAATAHYLSLILVEDLSSLLFTVLICLLFLKLTRFVRDELGEGKLLSYQTRVLTEIGGHRRRTASACIFSVLSAVSGIVYRFILVDTESVALKEQTYTDTTHLYIPRVDFYWIIDLVLALAFFCMVLWYLDKLKESLRYKYSLEEG